MKNPLKSLIVSGLMVGMLVTFCNPSQAYVSGNMDSLEAENGTGDGGAAGEHPVTLTVRYHVTNTGFRAVTAVQDLEVYPYPDQDVLVASNSKNTFAAGQTTTYDYNTCNASLAYGDYIVYGYLTAYETIPGNPDELAYDEWGLWVEPG